MQIDRDECRGGAWADLVLVGVATALFAFLSAHFELGELVSAWTRPQERYQLDELPGVLLFMALGFAWLAWRRWGDVRKELRRRIATEATLTAALAENRRLEHANRAIQEDERRSLARELHDELGQYLNAIKVDAVTLSSDAGDVAAVRRGAVSIVGIVDRVQTSVRGMVQRLRPVGLDELGLEAAIEECVDGWRRRLPSVRFDYDFAAQSPDWGEAVNMAVFRLVQEGLTNVARHARASRVAIRIDQLARDGHRPGTLRLDISDDGVGIAPGAPSSQGLGLAGMRERVESLGGVLQAANAARGGFRVTARIPLQSISA
jgi:signal transduction histidine kinase